MFEVYTTSFHTNVDRRLVAERAKFAKHVMVSVGVCFGGKGRLHFIPDTAKVNATLEILPSGFIVQQDGAPDSLLYSTHGKGGSRLDCYQLQ